MGVPCFIAFLLLELAYSKTHDHSHLYEWKDLAASSFLGTRGSTDCPFDQSGLLRLSFQFSVRGLCNPLVNGERTNILGYPSFGWAWYIWLICQFLDDFTITGFTA